MMNHAEIDDLAERLAALHEVEFGGKSRGRFRISRKFLNQLAGRQRLYPETITALQRKLYELGLILVDMDTYFAVLSARTFSTYRRVGPAVIGVADAADDDARGPHVEDSADD